MAQKIEYFGKTDAGLFAQYIKTELDKYYKMTTTDSGKHLSTEDFTTALKTKLEGIDLSQYSTTTEMNTAITNAIKDITGIKFVKVASFDKLPAVGEAGTIYLVPKATASTSDVYIEYYWSGTDYEIMGTTAVDLSGYVQFTDLEEIPSTELKAIWDTTFGA